MSALRTTSGRSLTTHQAKTSRHMARSQTPALAAETLPLVVL